MKKTLVTLAGLLFTLLTVALVGLYYVHQNVQSFSHTAFTITEPQTLELKRGTSFNQLLNELQKRQLITETWPAKVLIRLQPDVANIRSGYYDILPGDTFIELIQRLNQGKEKVFSITLIEGQNIKEWRAVLASSSHTKDNIDNVFNAVLVKHGDESGLPEGKFYPDTYHYHAGATLESIVEQSYLKMQQQLAQIWQARDESIPLSTPYELLIMASIIEKETGKASERPWISAVFTNRLRKGMRLQTDPTVIYGMGDRYQGNITRKDLREHTPFNTYRINGLTPTPIAAPSGASLHAAANPADVDYFYFVSKNDGSHVFSRTLAEHNRAVNKYQRNR
ncbi:endolytic transglycosylase MltG [Shewanella waksmanii]|uniref:endolytic transglycosylase MltG n=1 Tax=Shewanella waksmanii TaxID=213783 RepID=UPI00048D5E93|nr:endolytic transglycosylase MltG [Shewanella waksmanii]